MFWIDFWVLAFFFQSGGYRGWINVEAKGLSVLGSGISLGAVPTVGVGAEELYIAVRVGAIVEVDSKTTQYLHDSI